MQNLPFCPQLLPLANQFLTTRAELEKLLAAVDDKVDQSQLLAIKELTKKLKKHKRKFQEALDESEATPAD